MSSRILRDGQVYLDVIDGSCIIEDPDGSLHTDLEVARAEAIEMATELICESLKAGRGLGLARIVRIVGSNGEILGEMTFAEAVERSLKER